MCNGDKQQLPDVHAFTDQNEKDKKKKRKMRVRHENETKQVWRAAIDIYSYIYIYQERKGLTCASAPELKLENIHMVV